MLKPGEERLANFYLHLQPDALLIRSAGMLQHMTALRTPGTQSQRFLVAAWCKLVMACLEWQRNSACQERAAI